MQGQIAEPGRLGPAQGDIGDMPVLELILVDDRQGTGSGRVVRPVPAVIEVVIDDDHRPVVPAQGRPAAVVIAPIPVHPAGAPVTLGDPVPAQAQSPVPAPVVIGAPAPRLIGDPAPAASGIPEPAAVIIGPPVVIVNAGDPDISIGPFIDPATVLGKLVFVVFELGGKIAFGDVLAVEGVPVGVPEVEIIPPTGQVRMGSEASPRGQKRLPAADEQGPGLAGRLHGPLEDRQFGLAVLPHVKTVESFLQRIERGVRCVQLECLLIPKEIEAKDDPALEEMDPDPVVAFPGHIGKLHERRVIETQEVLAAETELCPAGPGFQLISLDQSQVDDALFRPKVSGSQDDHMALDIGQSGETVAVVSFFLGESEDR